MGTAPVGWRGEPARRSTPQGMMSHIQSTDGGFPASRVGRLALKRKLRGVPGRHFLTKTKAGGIWAYCDGIKHADAHTPQVGSTHPADTQPWKSCGHLRLIVAKIRPFGESDGGRSSGDALPLLFNELRSPLEVGGREIAMIASSSNRVRWSHGNRMGVLNVPVRLRSNV